MSIAFYSFLSIVVLLLVAFAWLLRSPKKHASSAEPPSAISQDFHGSHITYLPQIQRALSSTDYEYASKRIPRQALRRMRRERKQVALGYLDALHDELVKLLRTARVIASLSPKVVPGQEFERALLAANFLFRYRLIRLSVWAGFSPLPQISDLSNLLSGYSVRLEEAMKEMGERAALIAEMVSPPDRRRIHPV
ncbi:MAG TPA: hypothetical protein VJN89_07940 [Candidatus Acidoferrum sp.]|nr:hypothetical protein [Candidatus Acidoferrum sp.]